MMPPDRTCSATERWFVRGETEYWRCGSHATHLDRHGRLLCERHQNWQPSP